MSSVLARRPIQLAVVLVLASLAIVIYTTKVAQKMPDFEVYWRAGQRAAAGEPLYRADDGHYQLKYLPGFAVLMTPLAALPPPLARALWFGGSLGALALLVVFSLRLCVDRRKAGLVLVLITIAVMAKFYARELVLGQVNAMFAAIAAGALLAMRERREGLAGVLLALAVLLKPYGLLLVPWLVARREPVSIGSFAAGIAAALSLPLIRYDLSGTIALHRDWWTTVLSTTAPNLLNPDNVSWLAMYARAGARWPPPVPTVLWAITAVAAAVLMAAVWRVRHRVRFPEALEGALLLLLIPLVSPQGWDYVLLVGTPAVLLVVNHEAALPRLLRMATAVALVAIGLTIYDLMGRQAYHGFLMASGITIATFVVIAALATLRARAAA